MWRLITGIAAWWDCGTLQCLHDRLRDESRAAAGWDLSPTAAVIDFQSVKALAPCRRPAGAGAPPRRSTSKRHMTALMARRLASQTMTPARQPVKEIRPSREAATR